MMMKDIEKAVSDYYGVDIRTKSRARKYFYPRVIAIHLMREKLRKSLAEIAIYFNQDHTSILNALRVASRMKMSKTDIRIICLTLNGDKHSVADAYYEYPIYNTERFVVKM